MSQTVLRESESIEVEQPVAVTKITLVDNLDKMRPQTTPSKEYSILMRLHLKDVSSNAQKKPRTANPSIHQEIIGGSRL